MAKMASPARLRAVYKTIESQEIDTDVYLPQPGTRVKHPVIIDIHGGAFMLGSSDMVNQDQVADCIARGWIVVAPNHRLCPQVDLLEGPMQDCRDLLAWIYDGGLQKVISERGDQLTVDTEHVFAFGTSSGGHLSLCLGFDVARPVAAIYDMYGPCNFSAPFWTNPVPHVAARLPPNLTDEFLRRVYDEKPVPIRGGVSLEGQARPVPPDFSDPRQAFAMTQIGKGAVINAIFPPKNFEQVDPLLRVGKDFPPTFIVHGLIDTMVPIDLSRDLFAALQTAGVKSGMREIPGEEHTFAARMEVGSQTWNMQREGFDFLESCIKE